MSISGRLLLLAVSVVLALGIVAAMSKEARGDGGEARSDGVLRFQDGAVLFRETPCAIPAILIHVPADMHQHLMQATMHWRGADYEICWVVPPPVGRVAILVYEGGDYDIVPLELIKYNTGV